jgi:hypothetical protein
MSWADLQIRISTVYFTFPRRDMFTASLQKHIANCNTTSTRIRTPHGSQKSDYGFECHIVFVLRYLGMWLCVLAKQACQLQDQNDRINISIPPGVTNRLYLRSLRSLHCSQEHIVVDDMSSPSVSVRLIAAVKMQVLMLATYAFLIFR